MYIWPGLMAMNHLLIPGVDSGMWLGHHKLKNTSSPVQRHSSQNWVRVLVCVCLGWISQQKQNVYFWWLFGTQCPIRCGICWPVFQFHLLINMPPVLSPGLQPARKRRSSLLWKLWDAPAPSLQGARRCTCPTSLASPSTPRRTEMHWTAERKFLSYQLMLVSWQYYMLKILQNTACALVHLLCLVARTRSPKRFACLYFLGKRSILLVAPVRIWRSLNHDYGRLFFG